jgi:ZIP family zinc transporter
VITALLVGSVASSALVVGAVVGSTWSPPKQVTGVLLAFASGALISALAFGEAFVSCLSRLAPLCGLCS